MSAMETKYGLILEMQRALYMKMRFFGGEPEVKTLFRASKVTRAGVTFDSWTQLLRRS